MTSFVSAKTIAERIGMSANFIRDQAAAGRFPEYRFSERAVRYDPNEVAKALGFTWIDEVPETSQPTT
jgi:hypothetical protein